MQRLLDTIFQKYLIGISSKSLEVTVRHYRQFECFGVVQRSGNVSRMRVQELFDTISQKYLIDISSKSLEVTVPLNVSSSVCA